MPIADLSSKGVLVSSIRLVLLNTSPGQNEAFQPPGFLVDVIGISGSSESARSRNMKQARQQLSH